MGGWRNRDRMGSRFGGIDRKEENSSDIREYQTGYMPSGATHQWCGTVGFDAIPRSVRAMITKHNSPALLVC
jgi:hypothetical protein